MAGFVEYCNRTVRWGLLALIVFTPLAFGTVEDWSIALTEWGIVTLFLVFMAGRLLPGYRPRRSGIWRTGLEWIFAFFLLFCLGQTIPLPAGLLSAISPGSARVYGTEIPSFEEEPGAHLRGPGNDSTSVRMQAEASGGGRPVSLRPGKTMESARLAGCFMLLFLLSAWWVDRRERMIYLVTAVTTVGFLVALQALVQFMTWNGNILWLRPGVGDRAFGPFVNHNHFAGYVEMIIPLAIGLSLYLLDQRRHLPTSMPMPAGRSEDDEETPPIEMRAHGRREKGVLTLFAAVLLVVSLFFCRSRGGLLSALVSGAILLILLWKRMASRRIAWAIVVCLPLLVVAIVFWIGPDEVFEQLGSYDGFTNEASFRSRVLVWRAMIDHIGAFLWAGSGLGTFEESFAPFTPPGATARWHRAHNDYLQLFWETGAFGFVIFLAAGLVFLRRYWWPALRSPADSLDVIRIGAAVSLMSIALHSLVDFNLQVGSNGFLFALMAGLLAALSRPELNPDAWSGQQATPGGEGS